MHQRSLTIAMQGFSPYLGLRVPKTSWYRETEVCQGLANVSREYVNGDATVRPKLMPGLRACAAR